MLGCWSYVFLPVCIIVCDFCMLFSPPSMYNLWKLLHDVLECWYHWRSVQWYLVLALPPSIDLVTLCKRPLRYGDINILNFVYPKLWNARNFFIALKFGTRMQSSKALFGHVSKKNLKHVNFVKHGCCGINQSFKKLEIWKPLNS